MAKLTVTRVFRENRTGKAKIYLNRGSTRASKTYSIVQLAVVWLTRGTAQGKEQVWAITRKTLPALKASAYRDFREIVNGLGLWPAITSNLSDLQFTFGNRTIEFFSLDDQTKVRSRKREHLHIVEANEITFEIWTQLILRTRGKVFADWNPSDPFSWLREEIEERRAQIKGDVKLIVSTYKDNPFLTKAEVAEIEYLKEVDHELWRVFGEGQYGQFSDIIFKDYEQCDYPDDCDYQYLGIDFGYTNDPAAVVLVGKSGNNIYLKELVYETQLTNQQLAQRIKATGYGHIPGVADSAEPKSIAELNAEGLQIWKAVKGADSVRFGIMLMRQFDLHVDPGSINLLKELRAYKWSDKKSGTPVDAYNHCIDGSRYVISKHFKGSGGMRVLGVASNYRERQM